MKPVPLWRRYARFFGADPAADVDDELEFHLETKIDELTAQGWNREDAEREALRQFGNVRQVREIGEREGEAMRRDQNRRAWLNDFGQDMRYAVRTLRREPGFALITVLVLALGVAANTAVFSVVNTVMLRPLPFPEPQQLTWFQSGRATAPGEKDATGLSGTTYTVAAYEEFRRHNRSFASVSCFNPFYANSEYTLTGSFAPQYAAGVMVADDFFQTLGVEASLGRLFRPGESAKGAERVVLLSHAFWKRHFGGDTTLLGKAIQLNQEPYTVVGVLPARFDFGAVFAPGTRFDLFVPAILEPMRDWGNTVAIVGRLKPGVSVQQAQAEADALFPELKRAHPEWWGTYTSYVRDLKEHVSGTLRRPLMLLWCAVGLILLIVCVNLSNLLLARTAARSKEFAVRTALGAGRTRLFRQLFVESALLLSAGAAMGIALATALTHALAQQGSIALPLLANVEVDRSALLWTLGTSIAMAFLFVLGPTLRASSGKLQDVLKDGGHGMSVGRAQERLRGTLVVSEVALACVLLIGAGLLLRSFLRVLDVDLGFQPSQAAVIRVDYDRSDAARRGVILQEMLERIRAIPGVEAAGVADMLPLGRNRSWGFGPRASADRKAVMGAVIVRVVTPGYLEAMGIRLKGGRDFSWTDGPESERVIIINEAAARLYWGESSPVGQPARALNGDVRIIGYVRDVRDHGLETVPGPEMYVAVTQARPSAGELVIRSRMPPQNLTKPVWEALRSLNPSQPQEELRPLQRIVDRAVSPRKFFALLVTTFAGLGLLLATLGIYGVVSYATTMRRQEIGIRMALGASPWNVQSRIVGGALRLALAGLGAGALLAGLGIRWISSMLFGIAPTDPETLLTIACLLAGVAAVAGYIPARRAVRANPISALRNA